ncbi:MULTISPECIES: sporulation-specific diadenylate cyclase CdaS [Neobacillus]|uniref:Diadenylate cyclase n=1 Tax=Neobacillus rhizophilus TaxID=2833579 RepID=A0A942YT37_9BACI|nr:MULTISPECIES: sporulation-specific diadenylate cyclase CdaS [Neobacillus]MBS4211784.1 sporulation-specific diadenylate cyclase CdaS [Neobacillus rhizophilus]MBU8919533.1 sporulation-specific diadenylate cyclase CdaS [Bacillus sp. FJAT-29953]
MDSNNCDFSPMKQNLEDGIQQLILMLQSNLEILGNENFCVLGSLEDVKEHLMEIESMAASFYLNCYLSSFTDTYEHLSTAAQHLSKHRHGALIVVERCDLVEPIIQKGTTIGAIVTPKLLESIFYPGNPLHDGAVLIRGNHVVSAGNVLPLTTIIIEEKKLGTRHRAALGISERSDALALVVSEETGKISFALKGKLYPINTTQPIKFELH